jgi:hypothetical protein
MRDAGKLFAVVCIGIALAGCGGGIDGSDEAKTVIPECGFSMDLPAGWVTEQYAKTEFFKKGDRDNNWGAAKLPLVQGDRKRAGTFKGFITWIVEKDRFQGSLAEVISQRPFKVGQVGADAHELIFKTQEGTYAFNIFIEMDDWDALQIIFSVSADEYENLKKQFPAVVGSIQLASKRAVFK